MRTAAPTRARFRSSCRSGSWICTCLRTQGKTERASYSQAPPSSFKLMRTGRSRSRAARRRFRLRSCKRACLSARPHLVRSAVVPNGLPKPGVAAPSYPTNSAPYVYSAAGTVAVQIQARHQYRPEHRLKPSRSPIVSEWRIVPSLYTERCDDCDPLSVCDLRVEHHAVDLGRQLRGAL